MTRFAEALPPSRKCNPLLPSRGAQLHGSACGRSSQRQLCAVFASAAGNTVGISGEAAGGGEEILLSNLVINTLQPYLSVQLNRECVDTGVTPSQPPKPRYPMTV